MKRPEYRTFNGKQYLYEYTIKTKGGALASKKALKKQGKLVRITKSSRGYSVWARKPL